MFRFNLGYADIIGTRLTDLNTLHVSVQQAQPQKIVVIKSNLNTLHVSVQHSAGETEKAYGINLNTLHVSVQPSSLLKIQIRNRI